MKDFDTWNQIKKLLDEKKKAPFIKARDIWFLKVGKNIGHEQDGTGEEFLRPVVVIKKFNEQLFWGIPLTSRDKPPSNLYYFPVGVINTKLNWAILSQGRTFDSKRLKHKLGVLPKDKFQYLIKATIKILFDI